jgi:HTH-type transcriptional regulator, competence development regulator
VGISPAYLSRIERDKERPPRPEVIKELARVLAADPDVLFRLSSSTDPEVLGFLHQHAEAIQLVRFLNEANFTPDELTRLMTYARRIRHTAE